MWQAIAAHAVCGSRVRAGIDLTTGDDAHHLLENYVTAAAAFVATGAVLASSLSIRRAIALTAAIVVLWVLTSVLSDGGSCARLVWQAMAAGHVMLSSQPSVDASHGPNSQSDGLLSMVSSTERHSLMLYAFMAALLAVSHLSESATMARRWLIIGTIVAAAAVSAQLAFTCSEAAPLTAQLFAAAANLPGLLVRAEITTLLSSARLIERGLIAAAEVRAAAGQLLIDPLAPKFALVAMTWLSISLAISWLTAVFRDPRSALLHSLVASVLLLALQSGIGASIANPLLLPFALLLRLDSSGSAFIASASVPSRRYSPSGLHRLRWLLGLHSTSSIRPARDSQGSLIAASQRRKCSPLATCRRRLLLLALPLQLAVVASVASLMWGLASFRIGLSTAAFNASFDAGRPPAAAIAELELSLLRPLLPDSAAVRAANHVLYAAGWDHHPDDHDDANSRRTPTRRFSVALRLNWTAIREAFGACDGGGVSCSALAELPDESLLFSAVWYPNIPVVTAVDAGAAIAVAQLASSEERQSVHAESPPALLDSSGSTFRVSPAAAALWRAAFVPQPLRAVSRARQAMLAQAATAFQSAVASNSEHHELCQMKRSVETHTPSDRVEGVTGGASAPRSGGVAVAEAVLSTAVSTWLTATEAALGALYHTATSMFVAELDVLLVIGRVVWPESTNSHADFRSTASAEGRGDTADLLAREIRVRLFGSTAAFAKDAAVALRGRPRARLLPQDAFLVPASSSIAAVLEQSGVDAWAVHQLILLLVGALWLLSGAPQEGCFVLLYDWVTSAAHTIVRCCVAARHAAAVLTGSVTIGSASSDAATVHLLTAAVAPTVPESHGRTSSNPRLGVLRNHTAIRFVVAISLVFCSCCISGLVATLLYCAVMHDVPFWVTVRALALSLLPVQTAGFVTLRLATMAGAVSILVLLVLPTRQLQRRLVLLHRCSFAAAGAVLIVLALAGSVSTRQASASATFFHHGGNTEFHGGNRERDVGPGLACIPAAAISVNVTAATAHWQTDSDSTDGGSLLVPLHEWLPLAVAPHHCVFLLSRPLPPLRSMPRLPFRGAPSEEEAAGAASASVIHGQPEKLWTGMAFGNAKAEAAAYLGLLLVFAAALAVSRLRVGKDVNKPDSVHTDAIMMDAPQPAAVVAVPPAASAPQLEGGETAALSDSDSSTQSASPARSSGDSESTSDSDSKEDASGSGSDDDSGGDSDQDGASDTRVVNSAASARLNLMTVHPPAAASAPVAMTAGPQRSKRAHSGGRQTRDRPAGRQSSTELEAVGSPEPHAGVAQLLSAPSSSSVPIQAVDATGESASLSTALAATSGPAPSRGGTVSSNEAQVVTAPTATAASSDGNLNLKGDIASLAQAASARKTAPSRRPGGTAAQAATADSAGGALPFVFPIAAPSQGSLSGFNLSPSSLPGSLGSSSTGAFVNEPAASVSPAPVPFVPVTAAPVADASNPWAPAQLSLPAAPSHGAAAVAASSQTETLTSAIGFNFSSVSPGPVQPWGVVFGRSGAAPSPASAGAFAAVFPSPGSPPAPLQGSDALGAAARFPPSSSTNASAASTASVAGGFGSIVSSSIGGTAVAALQASLWPTLATGAQAGAIAADAAATTAATAARGFPAVAPSSSSWLPSSLSKGMIPHADASTASSASAAALRTSAPLAASDSESPAGPVTSESAAAPALISSSSGAANSSSVGMSLSSRLNLNDEYPAVPGLRLGSKRVRPPVASVRPATGFAPGPSEATWAATAAAGAGTGSTGPEPISRGAAVVAPALAAVQPAARGRQLRLSASAAADAQDDAVPAASALIASDAAVGHASGAGQSQAAQLHSLAAAAPPAGPVPPATPALRGALARLSLSALDAATRRSDSIGHVTDVLGLALLEPDSKRPRAGRAKHTGTAMRQLQSAAGSATGISTRTTALPAGEALSELPAGAVTSAPQLKAGTASPAFPSLAPLALAAEIAASTFSSSTGAAATDAASGSFSLNPAVQRESTHFITAQAGIVYPPTRSSGAGGAAVGVGVATGSGSGAFGAQAVGPGPYSPSSLLSSLASSSTLLSTVNRASSSSGAGGVHMDIAHEEPGASAAGVIYSVPMSLPFPF